MNIKSRALLTTTTASFLTPFMGSSINVALPLIGKEFEVDTIVLGWIATSFLLAAGIFSVPFGRIADIRGRKRVFTIGLSVFTVGSLLSAVAPSADLLIAFRIIQGVGGAMIFTTAVAILTSIFPPAERGKAIGINTSAVYTGLSLGPFLGGYLTHNFGWRSIFLINIPISLFALILAIRLRGEWAEAKGETFDFLGSLIYGLMILFLIYGLIENAICLIVGLILLFLFVAYESKVKYPVLEIKLFRENAVFALSNLAALLNYSATFAVSFILSLYLQYIKNLDPQQAGLILLAQPVTMAVFAPLAGWISDKVESRVVASAGMALTALSLLIFSNISINTSISTITLNLTLLGFGLALFSSPNTKTIMNSVERKFFGVASATVSTMRLIGQILSMALVMLIFSIMMGRVEIVPEYFHMFIKSAKLSFELFTVLCIVGVFASLGRLKFKQSI